MSEVSTKAAVPGQELGIHCCDTPWIRPWRLVASFPAVDGHISKYPTPVFTFHGRRQDEDFENNKYITAFDQNKAN